MKKTDLTHLLQNIYARVGAHKSGSDFKRGFMNEFWPAVLNHYDINVGQREMDRFEKQFWKEIEGYRSSRALKKEGFINIAVSAAEKLYQKHKPSS